jgi:peroxiredoxin
VCKFRDDYSKFTEAGAVVYGISSDSPADNKAFADAQRLPFPLLTDPSSILRKVGSCVGEGGRGKGGRRAAVGGQGGGGVWRGRGLHSECCRVTRHRQAY